jgi:hypothetical protein
MGHHDSTPITPQEAERSALSALGIGLAAAQGDFVFVALFGAATIVAISEAIRRLR